MRRIQTEVLRGGVVALIAMAISIGDPLEAQERYQPHRVAIAVVDQSIYPDEPVIVVIGPSAWPSLAAIVVVREDGMSEEGVAQAVMTVRTVLERMPGDANPRDMIVRVGRMRAPASRGEGASVQSRNDARGVEVSQILMEQVAHAREMAAREGEAAVYQPPPQLRAIGANRVLGLMYMSVQPGPDRPEGTPEATR